MEINATDKKKTEQREQLQYRRDLQPNANVSRPFSERLALTENYAARSQSATRNAQLETLQKSDLSDSGLGGRSVRRSRSVKSNSSSDISGATRTGAGSQPRSTSERMMAKLEPYRDHIRVAAATYNLPEELIAGIIYQESRGNPQARSHCGAMGLMQLMPQTARHLGVKDAYDPAQNIDGGARYIRQMLDTFGGNLSHAVAAYNAGPGNVQKHGGIPPFRETREYVPHVLNYANTFRVAGGFAQNSVPSTAVRA